MLKIIFFGDSICVGQGVSIHSGWVTRTARMLDELAGQHGKEVVVTNASVNGNTTRQALERMPYDVQSSGVDILIVQFGMNDCNYWQTDGGLPRVSKMAFEANLREIIARGTRFGAKRVFLHTNHPTTRDQITLPHAGITYQDSNKEYNEIIRRVGVDLSESVDFVDIERYFQMKIEEKVCSLGELLLEDGLHLSEYGHQVYFDCLSSRICRGVIS